MPLNHGKPIRANAACDRPLYLSQRNGQQDYANAHLQNAAYVFAGELLLLQVWWNPRCEVPHLAMFAN
jgi:hypothetical protein